MYHSDPAMDTSITTVRHLEQVGLPAMLRDVQEIGGWEGAAVTSLLLQRKKTQ